MRGDGAEHGHLVRRRGEGLAVALDLLAHVPERVQRALAVEFVDGDAIGEVQHVDLLELAGGAEFGGHHVERHVHVGDDAGVALADARRLHHHQVEAGGLAGGDDVGQGGGHLARRAPRRHRAHVDAPARNRVHADAVTEQGAAAAAPGGVDGDHRDLRLVGVQAEAPDQFVDDGRLAGTAGPGDAEHGNARAPGGEGADLATALRIQHPVLQGRDDTGQGPVVARGEAVEAGRKREGARALDALQHVADHPLEAKTAAVLGCIDVADAVRLELAGLVGHDDAAAAGEHLDIGAAVLGQQVDHVPEVLHVAALVGTDGDGMGVLLDGRRHHFVHRAVVAQVNDLGAGGLEDSPHHVDRGIVAVEQAGRGDEAHGNRGLAGRLRGFPAGLLPRLTGLFHGGDGDGVVGHGDLLPWGRGAVAASRTRPQRGTRPSAAAPSPRRRRQALRAHIFRLRAFRLRKRKLSAAVGKGA